MDNRRDTMAQVAQDKTPLVWIDMEMSGLVPERDRILEVAMVVTDANLETIAEAPVYVLHQSDEVLEGMDSWNKSTHGKSGLVDKVRASTLTEAEVERQLVEFLKPLVPERTAPLCGNTVHQDRRFMALYMPAFDNYLHYRIVDVSTLKELAKRWRPDVLAGLTKEGRHEALADIQESIEELRHYRRTFLREPEPAETADACAHVASSAQSRERATARFQPARRAPAASRDSCGSNTRSRDQSAAISPSSSQNPTARPARYAAPSAVVSVTRGRTTGTPRKFACICMRRLLAVAPPSTRSSVRAMALSAAMASISSALWKAIASRVARARCARVVPRVIPTIAPRACGSQYGAPSPESAGTKYTPAASGTLPASASISEALPMMPRPSRSHWIAAPAMKTLPSSA